MELRLNANAIITNKDNKILFVKLKKGPCKGGLCIPGGGINPGETGSQAAIREVKEETGIEVKGEIKPVGFYELLNSQNNSHRIVLIFKSEAEGNTTETEEASSIWMPFEEAESKVIPFAREAIKIWKNKENYFKIIE